MGDYGFARGPNDMRSHAQMLMDAVHSQDKHPDNPCPNCGGEFVPVKSEEGSNIEAIDDFRCESCGEPSYKWAEGYPK